MASKTFEEFCTLAKMASRLVAARGVEGAFNSTPPEQGHSFGFFHTGFEGDDAAIIARHLKDAMVEIQQTLKAQILARDPGIVFEQENAGTPPSINTRKDLN